MILDMKIINQTFDGFLRIRHEYFVDLTGAAAARYYCWISPVDGAAAGGAVTRWRT